LIQAATQQLADRRTGLNQAGKLLVSLSYKSVLARGYAVIKDADGHLVHQRAGLMPGDGVAIEFADGAVGAVVAGAPPPQKKHRPLLDEDAQESLF
jgi:exodeoxyribonuclease VII large subunit